MPSLRRLAPWVLAVVLGLSFLGSGLPKISPSEGMIARFEAWGYPPMFVVVIGLVETVGGLMVLVPRLAVYGAAVLAVDMIGAVYTHVSTGIGSPTPALVYLVLCVVLGWLRQPDRYARPGPR